jgi:hypothetical protein
VHYGVSPGAYFPVSLHPYDQARIDQGLPVRYPPGYGLQDGGSVAPAVVSPCGGLSRAPIPRPAPHVHPRDVPVPYSAVPSVPEYGMSMSSALPVDRRPTVDEFAVDTAEGQQAEVGVVELIRSLRSQTSGDMDFRRQNYPSAETFYRTATETAPSRRAPWLRLAWAQLAQQQFADATVSLKTALHMNDDAAKFWISGGLLFGDGIDMAAGAQNELLWEWLQERPNSTDQLLLTAAFQQLLGYTGVAREVLAVSQ